ncbi:hypothetical protein [Amycolatopsis albispora]|uniref:Uncharacterized protein n=1 Tax=Amycolatopsis albispora TaxID=1804986 RepID=A0A344LH02_9PSEU|nr:hypothetical protein [Amycolatopsis albispora]AXB47326.1 hypothetical protein A4R43_36775 [Amycolatopsis albispora]
MKEYDGLVICEFCRVFHGQTVAFNSMFGRLGVIDHLDDHRATGEQISHKLISRAVDWCLKSPFRSSGVQTED